MKITDVHKALMTFWKGFGVPAYVTGHVPDGATFPYITFDISTADAFGESSLTAFNWHKSSETTGIGVAMSQRATLMDSIANAIPYGGKTIPCGDGFLFITRKDMDFQTYYDDPTDLHVIGGRTAYDVQYNLR